RLSPLSTESRELAFLKLYWRFRNDSRQNGGFFYSRKSANQTFLKVSPKRGTLSNIVNDELVKGSKDRRYPVQRYANLDQFITSNWRC
ncbi:hypothetical protein, partial [Rodentibacter ratti]|uniref:hypothetical protein n=1 Tax=Rodentibacter ratti TaxID=1906745 RepID=UPI0015C381A9